jgi:transcriptional regulator with XRE-family HTH domain
MMMPTRDRLETLFASRLRLEMSAAGKSVGLLAAQTGLSDTAIRKLRMGKTKKPRKTTIKKICDALGISEEKFDQSLNGHVFNDFYDELDDLERDYGPSVRSTLTFGPRRTLWLSYDTCQDKDYG